MFGEAQEMMAQVLGLGSVEACDRFSYVMPGRSTKLASLFQLLLSKNGSNRIHNDSLTSGSLGYELTLKKCRATIIYGLNHILLYVPIWHVQSPSCSL